MELIGWQFLAQFLRWDNAGTINIIKKKHCSICSRGIFRTTVRYLYVEGFNAMVCRVEWWPNHFFRNVLTNPDILAPQNSPKYIQQIPKAGDQKIFWGFISSSTSRVAKKTPKLLPTHPPPNKHKGRYVCRLEQPWDLRTSGTPTCAVWGHCLRHRGSSHSSWIEAGEQKYGSLWGGIPGYPTKSTKSAIKDRENDELQGVVA